MLQPAENAGTARNIILAGFMGSGKTTVGRELAHMLNRQLVDTDEEVVRRHGLSIATVFTRYGEERFREWEAEIALELAMLRNLVVATGGGTLMNDQVFKELNVFGFTAYLRWPFEKLYECIIKNGKHRPLVEHYGKEGLRELLANREPRYRQAHVEIYADHYSPVKIAKVINHVFKS